MTARNRLVSTAEVEKHVSLLRKLGIAIGAVDIRADGVTIYPPKESPGNDFDQWLQKDADRDRPARRQ